MRNDFWSFSVRVRRAQAQAQALLAAAWTHGRSAVLLYHGCAYRYAYRYTIVGRLLEDYRFTVSSRATVV